MVMTYDGALVMTCSYAVMDEEEMTYVEGGAVRKVASYSVEQCNRMAAQVCLVGGIITAVAGVATAAISGYLWLASTYKGLNVYYNTSTRFISVGIRK